VIEEKFDEAQWDAVEVAVKSMYCLGALPGDVVAGVAGTTLLQSFVLADRFQVGVGGVIV
jgi:hypothetical protein